VDNEDKKILLQLTRDMAASQQQLQMLTEQIKQHVEVTTEELKTINRLDSEQNSILAAQQKSLDIHIEGVNTLKKLYISHREENKQEMKLMRQEVNARLEALELPYDYIKFSGKVFTWCAGALGVIAGVLKIVGMW